MDAARYLDLIARESEAFARAAEAAGLEAAVPTCPGWTVTDLAIHLAGAQDWARAIVAQGSTKRADWASPDDAPRGDALLAWFRGGARQLLETLTAADPAASIWTFGPDRTVTFWYRREALETAVHRIDAERAGSPGVAAPVDADLASDGVDEYLSVFAPRFAKDLAALGGTIHVHCTDVDGEWLLAPDRETTRLRVTREHAKGDVAARGAASDLLLYLWGRTPVENIDVVGDVGLLERFSAMVTV
jgi:uncharacterized protein (TIGR03083 family)